MKIAIMQPYFLPYLGYFQLIMAVDKFIFLDNVSFIKKGWINRNQLKNKFKFTIPIEKQSQNKLIKETKIKWDDKLILKFRKNINRLYYNSLNFDLINVMLDDIMSQDYRSISNLAIKSVKSFSDYLNIKTEFKLSSQENYFLEKNSVDNIINICKKEGADTYVNLPGGENIYSEKYFASEKIKLCFIKTIKSNSIIDLCFELEKSVVIEMLYDYKIS